ncbi:MAG TPA: hypothetical protein VK169_16295 [Saprospiraceae bacterium]|jgi:hypothetical protein|nr:hypothetical protein [Saprospiraceae bacterium]
MKTQIFVILLSIFSSAIFAGSNPSVLVERAKTLVINTSNWKSEKVNVQIKEASGTIIMDEVVSNLKNSRSYNLKNLPSGSYTVEVSNDLKLTIQSFEIEGNFVKTSNDIATIYKPVVNWNDNQLDINLLTLGAKVDLNITDANNNTIFVKKFDTPTVHKRYDFSKLESGTYAVNIFFGGRSFSKTFTK